jgi:hypothetical protein
MISKLLKSNHANSRLQDSLSARPSNGFFLAVASVTDYGLTGGETEPPDRTAQRLIAV